MDNEEKVSTFAIIGQRYLDTEHDDWFIESLEADLRSRKITGIKRWLLEYIAASALWWNVFWWEWVDLSEGHILAGWVFNIIIALGIIIVPLLFNLIFSGNWQAGITESLIAIGALHIITLCIAISIRSGTKPSSDEPN